MAKSTKTVLVHAKLVREGKYTVARRLFKELLRGATRINVGLYDDEGWALAKYFTNDFNGYSFAI